MSWRNKLSGGASKNGDDGHEKTLMNFNREAMKQIGVQTVSSERLTERKTELIRFNHMFSRRPPQHVEDKRIVEKEKNGNKVLFEEKYLRKITIDELFEFYVDQWYDIWNMYKANQIAWSRAGSSGPFGKMVTAIEEMKEEIDVAIEANRRILNKINLSLTEAQSKSDVHIQKKLSKEKEQTVSDFHISYLVKLGFKFVSMMGNLCWLTEDVTIPATFPIMTNQPIQQQYPSTTMDHPKDFANEQRPTQNWGNSKYDKPQGEERQQ